MVKVRFAPAPTGYLHFGGARTAFFNWLFAKKENGKLVLRIEDTDQSRSTVEAISSLSESLSWLGLDWDEGPYRQTERFELYEREAKKLLQGEAAYYCYCQPEELDEKRRQARAKGKPPRYDRRCLKLSSEELKASAADRKPVIRFHAPDHGRTVVADLVRGRVSFENKGLEDFIIARSDGTPTYNFAAVADDHDMAISHVIRGEDHLSNTPKQILLYQALGWPCPDFAHLPLIVGSDRAPLSKRHGAVAVSEYREQGFLPEALLNYLALLGWSYDDKTTILSREEMIERFSLEGVNRSAAVFDPAKLQWMNGQYIRQMPGEALTEKIRPFLNRAGLEPPPNSRQSDRLPDMVAICQERISVLGDIVDLTRFFFKDVEYEPDAVDKILRGDTAPQVLKMVRERLANLEDFGSANVEAELRELTKELGFKARDVFQPIRVAVMGKMVTPPLFESLDILGKKEVVGRLDEAQNLVASFKA